jgi:SAM-dependent methyltransferase
MQLKDYSLNQSKSGLEFGGFSSRYATGRSAYDPFLITFLELKGTVLEVGAGTGQGTQLLSSLPVDLTVSEPDKRFLALLAANFPTLDLIHSSFEAIGRPFDYIVGFQCWHWFGQGKYLHLKKISRHGGYFIWRWYALADRNQLASIARCYSAINVLSAWLGVPAEQRLASILAELEEQRAWAPKVHCYEKVIYWSGRQFVDHAHSRIDHQDPRLFDSRAIVEQYPSVQIPLIETHVIIKLMDDPAGKPYPYVST